MKISFNKMVEVLRYEQGGMMAWAAKCGRMGFGG